MGARGLENKRYLLSRALVTSAKAVRDFLGFLVRLRNQTLVDMRDYASASDGRLDQSIEFFVTADGQLQVARCDPLHLQILARVSGQFQHFGRQVLQDRCTIHGSGRSHALARVHPVLQQPVDATDRELHRRTVGLDR